MTKYSFIKYSMYANTTLEFVLLTHSIPRTTLKYYHYLLYERWQNWERFSKLPNIAGFRLFTHYIALYLDIYMRIFHSKSAYGDFLVSSG